MITNYAVTDQGELAREINAVCGLLYVARERGYPQSLIGYLRALLSDYEAGNMCTAGLRTRTYARSSGTNASNDDTSASGACDARSMSPA
jgi:hypothetical protein